MEKSSVLIDSEVYQTCPEIEALELLPQHNHTDSHQSSVSPGKQILPPDLRSRTQQTPNSRTAIICTNFPPNSRIAHHLSFIYSNTYIIHLMPPVKRQQHRHSILPKMDYFRTLTQRSASETRVGDRVCAILFFFFGLCCARLWRLGYLGGELHMFGDVAASGFGGCKGERYHEHVGLCTPGHCSYQPLLPLQHYIIAGDEPFLHLDISIQHPGKEHSTRSQNPFFQPSSTMPSHHHRQQNHVSLPSPHRHPQTQRPPNNH